MCLWPPLSMDNENLAHLYARLEIVTQERDNLRVLVTRYAKLAEDYAALADETIRRLT
jgi:hypothetical protein